ncbi:AMP-dependent synthetase (plasmid) [Halorientalis sp. IM1011]|uniref:class I adenylate-forming enzyme family protein n=1 Tax=Halorientalis sp. IM1011 TaxID=1932360 RepID=UPI00097CC3E2|nr:class I adenylate-forming enzyme family protein [Halorientalis sp. IM1011]AQL44757.1 AMP-dependent synthetase [Halorientalis sp. IM1011]
MNFGNVVDHGARAAPGSRAVGDPDRAVTYGELSAASNAAATVFEERGVTPDDRVGICLRNGVPFLVAYLGAMKCGAVPVPINTRFTDEQVRYVLDTSDVSVLVTDEGFSSVARSVPTPLTVDGSAGADFSDELAAAATSYAVHPRRRDETAAVVYSSGTTGRPKGVRHTHGNVFANVRGICRYHRLTRDEVGLTVSQCYHVTGLNVTTTPLLLAEAENWFLPEWDPERVAATIERRRVTYTFLTPDMATDLLEAGVVADYDLSSLTRLVVGGAPMPADKIADVEAALGATVLEGYGMTETTPLAAFNRPGSERKAGSVGPPASEVVALRIEDVETGDVVDQGERGELLWRGDTVTPGFERSQHEADAFVERDGDRWLRSGDVGYLDSDGHLFVVGRRGDMFSVGCANVFPREIEDVLYEIDGVSGAAIVDALDGRQGAVITAVLTSDGGVSESHVRSVCNARLGDHKVPERIEFVEEIPRTATGKIDRTALRDRFRTTPLT